MSKWEMVKLEDVCDINMGQSPKSSSYNLTGEGIPFYQGNADFGEINPETKYYCDRPTKIAQKDDILLSVRAPIGAINIANETCCIGRGLAALSSKKNVSDTKYIYHILRSKNEELNSKGTGSTFKAINKQSLRNTLCPLPPLEIQKQIAKNLDTASELLAMRKQQLAELDNLAKAVFYDMFGDPVTNEKRWIESKIEDVIADEKNAIKAGPFGSALKKECYVKKGYKIYGQEQVINNDVTFGDYYISDEKFKELENCAIKEDDVLISLVGTYGKLLIIPKEFEKGIINPRLMKITFDKGKVNTTYFKYYFTSESMKNVISDKSRGGTMDILNVGIVRKLVMPLPPLSLQNQLATIVTKIEEQKSLVQKAIDETQLLFDSLMSQYFDQ